MTEKSDEIKRSYDRAFKEGYEIHLTTNSVKYYLDAIKELDEEISSHKLREEALIALLAPHIARQHIKHVEEKREGFFTHYKAIYPPQTVIAGYIEKEIEQYFKKEANG